MLYLYTITTYLTISLMTEKEKELKAFNQCADALTSLDNKSIYKVFQLLSIHFDFVTKVEETKNDDPQPQKLIQLPENISVQKTKSSTAKKSISKTKKGGSNSSSEPIFLSDFDFMPKDNISLREFLNKYKASSNLERNLVFLYYFQEKLKMTGITTSHVYSCYRSLGLKIPKFPSTLNDTKALKGWIETSNYNDLKVTRTGINHLEHELIIND